MNSVLDKALGSVVGAFIGDSIGSYLEFKTHVTEEEVEHALTMPGGGPFDLIPGQVTDDSELALALARALATGEFDVDSIAEQYREWLHSGPFDRGYTIANALLGATNSKDCYKNAQRTIRSESNGGLMRITPLAVFCSLMTDDKLVEKIVKSEQSLTHSNKTVQDAAVAYVLAIKCLIRGGTHIDAFDITNENEDLQEYVAAIDDRVPGNERMGHAKIAWSYAFYHLKNKSSYLEAMKDVLLQAGDTDTNCAIVGGLVGAALGLEKLQEEIPEQIDIFMKCRPDRPYIPSDIIDLVKNMINVV
jgi:ADP-ribosylglycohydrolase